MFNAIQKQAEKQFKEDSKKFIEEYNALVKKHGIQLAPVAHYTKRGMQLFFETEKVHTGLPDNPQSIKSEQNGM